MRVIHPPGLKLFLWSSGYYWKADRARATLALAASALIGAAEYLEPYLFGQVVQLLTEPRGTATGTSSLWAIMAAWIVLVILLVVGTRSMSLATQDVAQEGSRRLWIRYVSGLYARPSEDLAHRTHPARILKAGIAGTNAGSELWQTFAQEQFQTVAGILIVLPAAFLLNPALAAMLLALVVGSFVLLYLNVLRTMPAEQEIEALEGGVAERASELIRHRGLILTSRATEREVSNFDSLLLSLRARYHAVARTWASVSGSVRGVFSLSMLLMLMAGIWLYERQWSDVGEIVTFVGVIGYVLAKVEMLIDSLRRTASRMPALAEFCAIPVADLPPLTTEITEGLARSGQFGPLESSTPSGGAEYIVMREVGFEYEAGRPVLANVNLTIPQGSIFGISGRSGIGKSTLMHLLLGLLLPSSGSILYQGEDLAGIPLDAWWRKLAVVFQDSHLLSRSIEDNLRLANPGASREDIESVTRALGLHQLILQLEDGYATTVGDIGRRFSGGQRQLLGIARALVAAPEFLLLDEPTSNLDPASERLVLQTLEALRGQCTIVLISHRQSTLKIASRVLRLDQILL